MMYGWRDGFGGFGGLWMIGGLLLVIGIVVLVVWLVGGASRASHHPPQPPQSWQPPAGEPPRPTPNEILRERFARGEINEEEFERAKKVLGLDRQG